MSFRQLPRGGNAYQADGKAFLKINAFELDARIPVTGAVKVWRFFEKFFLFAAEF